LVDGSKKFRPVPHRNLAFHFLIVNPDRGFLRRQDGVTGAENDDEKTVAKDETPVSVHCLPC
jgi:hypothetical protein